MAMWSMNWNGHNIVVHATRGVTGLTGVCSIDGESRSAESSHGFFGPSLSFDMMVDAIRFEIDASPGFLGVAKHCFITADGEWIYSSGSV